MLKKEGNSQASIFNIVLAEPFLDKTHPLFKLGDSINWKHFEDKFGPYYCEGNGRPAHQIRLMVSLHYLKAMSKKSDEDTVAHWAENPYWQYFSGEIEFQHKCPVNATTMGRWRKRIGEKGFEELLRESIEQGFKNEVIKPSDVKKVNADTTVMEKAISFPTDSKLLNKMREKLVSQSEEDGVELRQNYRRSGKKAVFRYHRYRHTRRGNKARMELKKIKNYLGRVLRDIERKVSVEKMTPKMKDLLDLGWKVYGQKREDSHKIYSLHAPEVECIAKGKVHKKYEFGCKVSFVTSSKGNFVLGAKALHGNPFDGHTLEAALDQATELSGKAIETAYVDLGYRGHGVTKTGVKVVDWKKKERSRAERRWMKRRAAIEPLIGHMKNDGGQDRNYLLGERGDKINALMMGIGFNMRKIAKRLSFYFEIWGRYFFLGSPRPDYLI